MAILSEIKKSIGEYISKTSLEPNAILLGHKEYLDLQQYFCVTDKQIETIYGLIIFRCTKDNCFKLAYIRKDDVK